MARPYSTLSHILKYENVDIYKVLRSVLDGFVYPHVVIHPAVLGNSFNKIPARESMVGSGFSNLSKMIVPQIIANPVSSPICSPKPVA